MLEYLDKLFDAAPLLAVFVTVCLGYVVGKLTIGQFVLGGVAGSLLVGVLIGQLGIHLDTAMKSIFFALFIYAVGYQGGPQFFRSINRRSLNQLVSAFVMCLVGLICVLISAWTFDLDRGTAAGLAAGGLTQSAIIGTAGDAIAKLGVSAEQIKIMQTNVAVGYAVCYIFGNLGPIIVVTWFLPMVMKWDIRQEAVKLAKEMAGGKAELEPGQFNAIRKVTTRIYSVGADSSANGKTAIDIDRDLSDAAVEEIMRNGQTLAVNDDTVIEAGDSVAVTGTVEVLRDTAPYFGQERAAPDQFQLVEEHREIILTRPQFIGKTIGEMHDALDIETRHGIYLVAVKRMGRDVPVLSGLELHKGDELLFIGAPKDLNRIQSLLGYKITAAAVTDFVFFGVGMSLGILLGLIEFRIAGIPVTIGTGGGCLLSGLLFGWLRSTHPQFAALPTGASNFLRDFGLAVFVAIVGISAGPQAVKTMQQYGLTLFFLGVGVTIIPQIVTFYFSYFVLRIRNPIEALGCVVGGRSANPGFAALLAKAGNATPVVSFTVTYAVANVFLTIWGPLIVGIITKNPSP
ncbi:aspartate-alanine antiporter [Hoeflea sp. TYP-13]|uniref:aspartate-alanine antiporter n=1 Tax=Hoeflea sp. TYP-13 TaxID=3230023 RepID=UPI0034C5C47F